MGRRHVTRRTRRSGERLLQPAPSLADVAIELPESPQRPGKLQPRLGIGRSAILRTRVVPETVSGWSVQTPAEHGSEVVVLALDPSEMLGLTRTEQPGLDGLRERNEVLAMSLSDLYELAAFGELLQPVLA